MIRLSKNQPDKNSALIQDSAAFEEANGRSLWQDARRRLFANKAAVVSMCILVFLIVLAALADVISPNSYETVNWDKINQPPTWDTFNIFGTDGLGRDLFVRTLYGARISFAVGVIATLVALVIGVTYGAVSGFIGGKVDEVMMRIVDILYSLPFMFIVIVLMVVFGRHIFLIFLALGAVEWLTMARVVRGQTLKIKHMEFIEAAESLGVPKFTIITRHIIPNVIGPVIIFVTLTIPGVILAESFLSFLGLGVQEPLTSWGRLISEGANEIETAPWLLLFPASFMGLTLFCFNFIGDGLRDALDPKDR